MYLQNVKGNEVILKNNRWVKKDHLKWQYWQLISQQ